MTALGQLGAQVKTVQKGKEIGGVKKQAAQIEAETGNGVISQILFDGRDLLCADPFHVVPKALTGKLLDGHRQEAAQHRFRIPGADLCFAGRGDTAVEGSQQEILTHGRTLVAAFGHVAIHGGDHIQGLGDGESGGGPAKFLKSNLGWLGTEKALPDAFSRTEIDGGDDFGLAVDALALAQIIVGLAAHDLLGEASHLR